MMATEDPIDAALVGARCWGIELDPRYRVLAVTVEPDAAAAPAAEEHGTLQLLCFPVSLLILSVTRPVTDGDGTRTELLTFDLELLPAVAQRLAGATVDIAVFGRPEPRPRDWGPRFSLEARTSAADGTRSTLTLDLSTDDGARMRLFARFDDIELRDRDRVLVAAVTGEELRRRAAGAPGAGDAAPRETSPAFPTDADRT